MDQPQIAIAHQIDDLEQERTRVIRAAQAALRLMVDGQHAMCAGRLEVANEFNRVSS